MVFEQYANYYDALYQDKDYAAECDFLEKVFPAYTSRPVRRILDLGCGTGGHALRLAQRGYAVTGVDRSPDMLRLAREKAGEARLSLDFVPGDIREFDIGRTFDAVIAMFAVMSYQTTNPDLAQAIRTARHHLEPGGLFIFDAWFGPAVLAERPVDRYRVVEHDGERIVRFAHPALDVVAQTVGVNYTVWKIRDGQLLEEVEEAHAMRFFFVQELAFYLEAGGFRLRHACPFLNAERELTERDWNMAAIAEAV